MQRRSSSHSSSSPTKSADENAEGTSKLLKAAEEGMLFRRRARAAKPLIGVRAQSMSDLAIAYVFLSLLTLVIALLVAAILVTP